jgi:hypothetical protein
VCCREEELRILRGEQDVGGSRGTSSRRGTGAAGGASDDGSSSSDTEGGSSGSKGGWGGGGAGVGSRGGLAAGAAGGQGWGSNMQQQQQQAAGGNKVSPWGRQLPALFPHQQFFCRSVLSGTAALWFCVPHRRCRQFAANVCRQGLIEPRRRIRQSR